MKRLINQIAVLSLSATLAACSPGGEKPTTEGQVHANGGVTNASVSSDGRFAIVAGIKDPAGLWNLEDNKRLFTWKNSKNNQLGIIATAFSPDGKYAATAERKNVALWNTENGNVLAYWLVKNPLLDIAVSDEGHYVLLGFNNGIAEYVEMVNGMSVRSFEHGGNINSVALSADGRYALTGSSDKRAILWDVQTGKQLRTFEHQRAVTKVAISPNSEYVFTAASQGNAYLWRLQDGEKVLSLGSAKITVSAVRFSKSGRYIAVASLPQKLQLWDIQSAKSVKTWHMPKPTDWRPSSTIIHAVGFNKDESMVLTEDSSGYGYSWRID